MKNIFSSFVNLWLLSRGSRRGAFGFIPGGRNGMQTSSWYSSTGGPLFDRELAEIPSSRALSSEPEVESLLGVIRWASAGDVHTPPEVDVESERLCLLVDGPGTFVYPWGYTFGPSLSTCNRK